MAITSAGYYGAVNDVQWAQLFESLPYWFRPTSYVPSIVAGQRRISLTAGVAFGGGIRDASTAAAPVDLPAPSSGGLFYLVVLRHTWNPNVGGTTTIGALTGSSTDGTPPSTPPTAMPTDLKTAPGTQYDVPVAWVHVRAADTTLTLFDARMLVTSAGIASAASPSALAALSAIAPVTAGARVSCASDGLTYLYSGTAWAAQTLVSSGGWAPGYGGDGGATTGDNGGTNGSFSRLGNHVFYSGRVLFGSSAVAGGAVITGFNLFGGNNNLTLGSGFYRIQGGVVWPFILRPVTPSEFQILIATSSGAVGLSQITPNPPQSSELIFDAHAVFA